MHFAGHLVEGHDPAAGRTNEEERCGFETYGRDPFSFENLSSFLQLQLGVVISE